MKVFISWSGSQSNYIARALRDWLRDVIQSLTPWMSEVDTDAGERWGEGLWKELQDSQFGVVCLTAENLESPWLHYEAGALAKAVNGRVCPYLYDIKPATVKGPLSYHQAKQVDKQGTRDLLHSINNTAILDSTKTSLRPEQLDKTFTIWWPELEKKLNAVPQSTAPPPHREVQDMVEELLEIGRSLTREADSVKEEKTGILLERLTRLARTVPPTNHPIRDKLLDAIEKRIKDRSAFPNLEIFLSEEPSPPSDTPQEGKTPSK